MPKRERKTTLVRFSIAAAILGATACGSDDGGITPPPPPPPPAEISIQGVPAKDSVLHQFGLDLFVDVVGSLPFAGCSLSVDGTVASTCGSGERPYFLTTQVLAAGTHSAVLTYSVVDSTGTKSIDSAFTFVTAAPASQPYATLMFDPLPGDVSAVANYMNDSGVVVGESVASDGSTRPVRWVDGQVEQLAMSTSGSATATAVNARGDIVGSLYSGSDTLAVIWPVGDTAQNLGAIGRPYRINNARQILLNDRYDVAIYDFSAKTRTVLETGDVPYEAAGTDMNEAGQVIGIRNPAPFDSWLAFQHGSVALPEMHTGPVTHSRDMPWALNDSGEVVEALNDWGTFGAGSSYVSLNQYFGNINDSRANTVSVNNHVEIAAVGVDSSLLVWRKGSAGTKRAGVDPVWKFIEVMRLTDRGAILVHALNSVTGETRSMLLTPQS